MRLLNENCYALIIDVQEKLFPHMNEKESFLKRLTILIQGLQELKVPVTVTEQYVKGLGSTIEPVCSLWSAEVEAIEKITFSAMDNEKVKRKVSFSRKTTVIVAGIEAHVCILQTVTDLLEQGLLPVVPVDAITSRNLPDKEIAVRRMEAQGAIITTVESLLLELCREAGTDKFKTLSRLIK